MSYNKQKNRFGKSNLSINDEDHLHDIASLKHGRPMVYLLMC